MNESEISDAPDANEGRIRRPGEGRKSASEKPPHLYQTIEDIINENDDTYGTLKTSLRWTTWSLRKIADELLKRGINISRYVVSRALGELDYSKQQIQKTCQEGEQHPDRDAQFKYIHEVSAEFLSNGDPVISVDTKNSPCIALSDAGAAVVNQTLA